MMMRASLTTLIGAALIGCAIPAVAQLLPGATGGLGGLSGLPGPLGGVLGAPLDPRSVPGALSSPLGINAFDGVVSAQSLLSLRRERLRDLVRSNRGALDVDDAGAPIRRDEILALGATSAALEAARAAGFTIIRAQIIDGLGLVVTILKPPPRLPARRALALLKARDPEGSYEVNHVYQPAGGALGVTTGAVAAERRPVSGTLGMIDGGIGAHPAFANARIEQRGFAGPVAPSGHGTAVASLLVGDNGAFHGAAPAAMLLAADVYGGSAAAGSAEAIAQAMGWLAARGVAVINISLVGPPNRLLEASVRSVLARGILVVAAVGNDGPAAPVQYPAAYDGIIAVTGVDPRGRVLAEAGHAAHLDFAAPASEMAGAVPGGRYEVLRGTSFAAPIVAAQLVLAVQAKAAQPVTTVAAAAVPGKAVGRGIVCAACRIAPRTVGLR